MISGTELALLLGGADGDQQVNALASLPPRLIAAVVNGDAITAIRTTAAGDAKLNGMMLPPTNA